MGTSTISAELEAEIAAIAAAQECEVLQLLRHGDQLRVVLDHPEGVTLEHCEEVSRRISALLDVEDYGSSRYVLEVSSPGLDRPLLRSADWQRFTTRLVRVKYRTEDGRKQTVVGRLEAFDPADGGTAILAEAEGGLRHEIHLSEVEEARLEIEL